MIHQLVTTALPALLLPLGPIFDIDGGAAAIPVSGAGASEIAEIDAQVREYLDDNDLPGATVAVTKGSRLVWAKGYGYADTSNGTVMQPDSRSRIGSTSKILTAIGALGLVEDGALDLDAHVYGSGAAPLWGSEPGAVPGVVFAPDGILDDPGDYFDAMTTGVANVGEYLVLSADTGDWTYDWARYQEDVATTLQRASAIRVANLLSHTAGLRKSGGSAAKDAAVAHFGTTEDDLTEAQLHQAALMGMAGGALLTLDPGSEEKYSNWGFAFVGQIVGEASEEGDYRQYIDNHLLAPLGLFDVVPNNTAISGLDALPHDADNLPVPLDPDSVSRLLLATGGWSASARDLARVMCSIDGTSNNLRSLEPGTVETMESDAAPGAAGLNPLGWDSFSVTDNELTKNGDIDGGSSRITKFLPGAFGNDTDGEINVAVLINKGNSVPSQQLLRDIAATVADADVPSEYDLFDPAYACRVESSLAVSTPVTDPVRQPAPTVEPTIVDLRCNCTGAADRRARIDD
jgi:CubicO group peptidase (beta-lactamase class C family)